MLARDQNLTSVLPCYQPTGKLQVAFFIDEQVLRFEISVQDSVRVTIVQSFDELVGEFLPSV